MHQASGRRLGAALLLLIGLLPVEIALAGEIDDLRAACVAEVRKGGAPLRGSTTACGRYEAMTRGTAPSSATVSAPRSKAAKATTKPRKPRSRSESKAERGEVNECGEFDYGSIAYRHCRADEKKRLAAQCRQLSTRADRAKGENRSRLKTAASAQCAAAERYRIVD